jgi:putative flippase GtrA
MKDMQAQALPLHQRARAHLKHVSKFGAVGLANTLLDFLIYNLLSGRFGLTLVASNIISTTCAMVLSFFGNKKLVFGKHDGSTLGQALKFYAVTAFGLYVLQTGTIHLLTQVWTGPTQLALGWAHMLGLHGHDEFLVKNGVKVVATGISLTWNYFMYKMVVFR